MGIISTNVNKTGENIPTASFPVGTTCRSDAPCLKCSRDGGGCYGKQGHLNRKTYRKAMENNLSLYNMSPDSYYHHIHATLLMVPYKYFRWFVTGDMPDAYFLPGIAVRLAKEHKETNFLMFTKKYEIVNEYIVKGNVIPSNLKIVFSCWGDFIPANPYNLPMSYIRFKEEKRNIHIPHDAMLCEGHCEDCVKTDGGCWSLRYGEAVVFKKH